MTALVSSIESLERLERAHEMIIPLSMEVFPGALQTGQQIRSWREALQKEMNLKKVRDIIDQLAQSILWAQAPHHTAVVNKLHT